MPISSNSTHATAISEVVRLTSQPGAGVEPASQSTLSVVIPVFQAERTLRKLVEEITALNEIESSAQRGSFRILEILLVWDGARDNSAEVMKALAQENDLVKNIWLSRNFGQHAATLAGVSRSRGDWIVTLDEDGLHAPSDITQLLNHAQTGNYQLVYGVSEVSSPHGLFRNISSRLSHWVFKHLLGNEDRQDFSSFRLIRGDVGRSLSAYCGVGVYLDVALQWVTFSSVTCPIRLRPEWRPANNYNPYRLLGHFRRMVLSSPGTPLRAISLMGLMSIGLSLALSGYALYQKLTGNVPVAGWASLFILICFLFGILILSVGILAEYIGLILSISMGKPLYLVQAKPPGAIDPAR